MNAQPRRYRMRHREHARRSPAEERALALVGAINELIDSTKVPGGISSLKEPQADSEISR